MTQRELPEQPTEDEVEGDDQGRFQGGAGGPASNTGVYAETETYGGPKDKLGYGSAPEDSDEDTEHKEKPVTSVGAGPGGSMGGTADAG